MIVRPGIPEELRWFYEARFGMFVHFGLYAILGRGEWVMYHESIPRNEYEKLAEQFNPADFRAADWVDCAAEAGARYMTVTAKHHDGFCLFDSDLTDYKITNTPFDRDLIGELSEECERRGMPLVLYYSQPDWHHPNFVHWKGAFKDLDDPPATDEPDWERYIEYYHGQVEELMQRYRPAGIWFDGSHKDEALWRGKEIYELIKGYNAHAIVNDRARYGDLFTPERSLPEDLTGHLFEACQSVCTHAWGYRRDTDHYTVPSLIRSLQLMSAAGGNFLLNVGPKPDGTIPGIQRRTMREIGRWLDAHGEAIYATEPVADCTHETPDVRYTCKGRTLYVHFLRWPDQDTVALPGGLVDRIEDVRLLDSDAPIEAATDASGGHRLRLPTLPPDGLPAVAAVLAAADIPDARVPAPDMPTARPLAEELFLTPKDAARQGRGPKGHRVNVGQIPGYGPAAFGFMAEEQSLLYWVTATDPGSYDLWVDIAVPQELDDISLVIELDGTEVGRIEPTGSYHNSPGDLARGAVSPPGPNDFAGYSVNLPILPAGRHEIRLFPGKLHFTYLFGAVGTLRFRRT